MIARLLGTEVYTRWLTAAHTDGCADVGIGVQVKTVDSPDRNLCIPQYDGLYHHFESHAFVLCHYSGASNTVHVRGWIPGSLAMTDAFWREKVNEPHRSYWLFPAVALIPFDQETFPQEYVR